jgi:hypothetical protein
MNAVAVPPAANPPVLHSGVRLLLLRGNPLIRGDSLSIELLHQFVKDALSGSTSPPTCP